LSLKLGNPGFFQIMDPWYLSEKGKNEQAFSTPGAPMRSPICM
jgi:hypothetical protein